MKVVEVVAAVGMLGAAEAVLPMVLVLGLFLPARLSSERRGRERMLGASELPALYPSVSVCSFHYQLRWITA